MSELWATDDTIITRSDIIGDAFSQCWRDQKDVSSLTPMASLLVLFKLKIDFTAQKFCFSVSDAHLCPPSIQLWEALRAQKEPGKHKASLQS